MDRRNFLNQQNQIQLAELRRVAEEKKKKEVSDALDSNAQAAEEDRKMRELQAKKQRDYASALKAELRHKEEIKRHQRKEMEEQMKADVELLNQ